MKAAHSLLISCLLVIAMGHSVAASKHQRQLIPPPKTTPPTNTSPTPTNTNSGSTAPTNTATSGTDTTTTTSPLPPTSSDTTTSTSKSDTTTATNTPTPTTNTSPTNTQSTSTDPNGSTVIVTVTNPPSSTSSTSPSPTTKSDDNGNGDPGLGTGSIVAIAVSGGVAAIAIIAFIIWKFTRKRFADFDDNEAIKWPELNAHGGNADSHPLPVHNTGRSGFDTGSEVSLSRVPSGSGASHDPYAVPPLPHMNPNQPYRDDPTTASGYYDPYRGPIPGTLEHGTGADDWAGEAIPMTQMDGRMGPNAGYGGPGQYDIGRQSPGPQAAYGMGRTASPAPVGYTGRSSPGPQAAYGGRASPGPQAAYSAGRMSPGPQASYDQYGGR
ncbi:hypothetical protein LshimejAT787_0800960 [Lyophyllum shimeji]|uniref:Uncharacterized protein n=1 Tax=Lyophyllum shimeji TaxID=47721 RepID=A0A9P3UQI7_LYOSH|nr:hypothetical protein LshimejAT787_0800960 [Lyophyllum shimeji]